MTRLGLTLLLGMGLLGSAHTAWSEATATAAPTTVVPPASASAAAPAATTSAAPAAASAPVAQTSAPAASTAVAPAAATAPATASAATTAAPAPASAATATPAAAPAPEPAATPAAAETAAPAPAAMGTVQMPVRGMDMANVEHIFGTPLQKQDAVGKPPITRWVYTDYVVYFEYNKVLHTVMKSAPFQSPNAG